MAIPKGQDNAPATSLGFRLRALRSSKSDTQASFAERLGVPKSTYVAWERDEAEPPFSLFQKILAACGARAAFQAAELPLDASPQAKVDWEEFGRLCDEVSALSQRAGYEFEVRDIIEISGLIYEREPDQREEGLRDAERLLRISQGKKR